MYAARRFPTAVPFRVPSGSLSATGSHTRAHPRSHSSIRTSPSRRAIGFACARNAARSNAFVSSSASKCKPISIVPWRTRRRLVMEGGVAVPPLRLPAAVLVLHLAERDRDALADRGVDGAEVGLGLHQGVRLRRTRSIAPVRAGRPTPMIPSTRHTRRSGARTTSASALPSGAPTDIAGAAVTIGITPEGHTDPAAMP